MYSLINFSCWKKSGFLTLVKVVSFCIQNCFVVIRWVNINLSYWCMISYFSFHKLLVFTFSLLLFIIIVILLRIKKFLKGFRGSLILNSCLALEFCSFKCNIFLQDQDVDKFFFCCRIFSAAVRSQMMPGYLITKNLLAMLFMLLNWTQVSTKEIFVWT